MLFREDMRAATGLFEILVKAGFDTSLSSSGSDRMDMSVDVLLEIAKRNGMGVTLDDRGSAEFDSLP